MHVNAAVVYTIKDVAARAGVHNSTVSRALRNDPRISAAQRERIRVVAREMGYRPNPLVSALMTARSARREPGYRTTIAYLKNWPVGRLGFFAREFGAILEGARDRAEALGYRIEEFNLRQPELSAARASEILYHRGIHGLIIAPLPSVEDPFQLDWAKFTTVSLGYSFRTLPTNRVAHDHFGGFQLAAERCRAAGCRRLGLVVQARVNEKVERRWSSAALQDAADQPRLLRVPPLLLASLEERAFVRWFEQHRPDALLAVDTSVVRRWLLNRGAGARRTALVSLDRRPRDRGIAGVDQDYFSLGGTACDLLLGMLHRNELGVPQNPVTVLTRGTWVAGTSLVTRR